MVPSLSLISESCVHFLKTNVVSGFSALTAVKVASFLRSSMSNDVVPALICGSGLERESICHFGSAGKIGLFVCAERIDWLQLLKPSFKHVAKAVSSLSALPSLLLGFSEDSLLNISLLAIGEELFNRGLVQQVYLRELQKNIIKKFSDNEENLVDHPISKVTRIVVSSIIFGLMHTKAWECGYGGAIPEIAGGIIFGLLAEEYGLTSSSLAHISANLIILNDLI